MKKYIFVVPDNLGKFLFNDITALKNCEVIVVKRSLWGKVFLGKRSLFAKIIQHFSFDTFFENNSFCYQLGKLRKVFFSNNHKSEYILVFVAAASNLIQKQFMKKKCHKKNIKPKV